MTAMDAASLVPFIILASSAVLLALVIGFHRSHAISCAVAVTALAACWVSLLWAPRSSVTPGAFLVVDDFGRFYISLLVGAGIVTAILCFNYMQVWNCLKDEFYALLLTATLGCVTIVSANHFATFFLGLEILSVSLYAMIAYPRATPGQVEGSLKYLVLAAASSAFLLFGMAFLYFQFGTMDIRTIMSRVPGDGIPVVWVGSGMLLVGIGFKLAVVPFHLWTPDVYQGAPAPVAGFIAAASKGAVFAILLRLIAAVETPGPRLYFLLSCLAIASMFAGNLLALLQNNIKRLLAYSSIANIGYLMTMLVAGGPAGVSAASFYLLAYFVTILGAFGVVGALSTDETEPQRIGEFRGLAYRRPVIAAIFTAMLFSLAGIPLTAGFVGKFYIIKAGTSRDLWLLMIVLAINSAISLFYYLRVIVALYWPVEETAASSRYQMQHSRALPWISGTVLVLLLLLLIWAGVYPKAFVEMTGQLGR